MQALRTTTANTREARQALYYDKTAEIRRTLTALTALLDAHAVQASSEQYHWGYIGDLTHIQEHLNELLTNVKE